MDDERRKTLLLIEDAVRGSTPAERGRQLVFIVRDYVDDGDMAEALRVLRLVEQSYFNSTIFVHVNEDRGFGEAVAELVEQLGLDFDVLSRAPGRA